MHKVRSHKNIFLCVSCLRGLDFVKVNHSETQKRAECAPARLILKLSVAGEFHKNTTREAKVHLG